MVPQGPPIWDNEISLMEARIKPTTISDSLTLAEAFFRRYLTDAICSRIEFSGIPKTWDEGLLKYLLICLGCCCCFDAEGFGNIIQPCGFIGRTIYWRPARALVTNYLLPKQYDLEIGKDCEIIRLTPSWFGISDLIGYYADKMANCAGTIDTNLFNSRLSYIFLAGNSAEAKTFSQLYDKITRGEPLVIADKKIFNADGTPAFFPFFQNLKQTYIANDAYQTMRSIEADFYTKIGVRAVSFEKKERLTNDEVNTQAEQSDCLLKVWEKSLRESMDLVNAHFGLSVSVKTNTDPEPREGGDPDGSADAPRNR